MSGSLSDLTLARVFTRVDVHPKSMLYHTRRLDWAAEMYPSPYEDWELGTKTLQLRSKPLRREMTTEGSFVAIRVDRPEDVNAIANHAEEIFQPFIANVCEGSTASRFGWRAIFVTEGSSFEELFPLFRTKAGRHEKDWMRVPEMQVRDLGYVNVYYGTVADGLKLTIRVLTPDQVNNMVQIDFAKFEDNDDHRLDVSEGCLMIDLDRYVADSKGVEPFGRAKGWHSFIEKTAQKIARGVLQ